MRKPEADAVVKAANEIRDDLTKLNVIMARTAHDSMHWHKHAGHLFALADRLRRLSDDISDVEASSA